MIDPALHAQLIHAAKLMVTAILTAGFIAWCWLALPYFINGGPRR
jgi:hypothetical protein